MSRVERTIKKLAKRGGYDVSCLFGDTLENILSNEETNGETVNWGIYSKEELQTTIYPWDYE